MGRDWGGRDWGHMAQKRKLEDGARELRSDIGARDEEIRVLRNQISQLQAEIDALRPRTDDLSGRTGESPDVIRPPRV
jgi:predicted  nucleic acid-binding Zn-ribbon protein